MKGLVDTSDGKAQSPCQGVCQSAVQVELQSWTGKPLLSFQAWQQQHPLLLASYTSLCQPRLLVAAFF